MEKKIVGKKPAKKTKQQKTDMNDFELLLEAAKPLMEYLKKNHEVHTKVIVTRNAAEVFVGLQRVIDPQAFLDE